MSGATLNLAILIVSIISANSKSVPATNSSVSTSILQSYSALTNLAGFFNECQCYSRNTCTYLQGVSFGWCPNNNVCCVFLKTCGNSINTNLTYFTSPSYPMPYSGGERCALTIPKLNNNICQLRLDFVDFSIAQPTSEGVCNTDSLLISGSGNEVPRICGENSGQHIYVNYHDGLSPIMLYIYTSPDATQLRRWNIQISQIECNSPVKAPSGCLQYHTSLSGTVTSFNYGITSNPRLSPTSSVGTREMTNLNYGVCIRVEDGYCSLRWSAVDEKSFTVSGNASAAVSAQNASCTTDYVIIPDASSSENNVKTNLDRYCGVKFDTKITSLKPFVLYVVTDKTETPTDESNRGFSLNYRQLLCSIF